jgi:hypothetical protein
VSTHFHEIEICTTELTDKLRCITNRVVISKATRSKEEERPAEAAAAAWPLVWQLCAVAASLRKVARHAPTVLVRSPTLETRLALSIVNKDLECAEGCC